MMDNIVVPEDINKEWFGVIRRLQSVSKSNGLSNRIFYSINKFFICHCSIALILI